MYGKIPVGCNTAYEFGNLAVHVFLSTQRSCANCWLRRLPCAPDLFFVLFDSISEQVFASLHSNWKLKVANFLLVYLPSPLSEFLPSPKYTFIIKIKMQPFYDRLAAKEK